MAKVFRAQNQYPGFRGSPFDEGFGLLVDQESTNAHKSGCPRGEFVRTIIAAGRHKGGGS